MCIIKGHFRAYLVVIYSALCVLHYSCDGFSSRKLAYKLQVWTRFAVAKLMFILFFIEIL